MSRIIVTGSRHATDVRSVSEAMSRIVDDLGLDPDQLVIVHGAAPGLDSLVDQWARVRGVTVQRFPAAWRDHDRDGWTRVPCYCHQGRRTCKAAGPRRNQQMAAAGADLCLAFPGGDGTSDMVRRARAAGIRIVHAGGVAPALEAQQLELLEHGGVA